MENKLIFNFPFTIFHLFNFSFPCTLPLAMKHVHSIIVITLLLAAPLGAHAAQETVWSFLGNNVPGKWESKGLSPNPAATPDGMLIQTNKLGTIKRSLKLQHPIEWIEIEYMSATPTKSLLISKSINGSFTELPFVLEMTIEPKTVYLDISTYNNWNPYTTEIGFAFPAGAHVLIRTIRFSSSNFFEKGAMVFRSFWEFDQYAPYTINFLWGPRIAMNTAELAQMYKHISPRIPSINLLFYILILVVTVPLIFRVFTGKTERDKALLLVLSLTGALWLIYDIRMGTEFVTYAVHDYQTYVSKPIRERVFRVRSGFNAFSELIQPYIKDEEDYVFLPRLEPSVDFLRYDTYPALPVKPEQAKESTRYWAIFERPDVLIDEEGQLIIGGEVQTPPGEIVEILDNDSFLFRVTK